MIDNLSSQELAAVPAAAQAVATMSPLQREALNLICGENYSYQEAAETLNLSVEQVRSYLLLARLALISQLQ